MVANIGQDYCGHLLTVYGQTFPAARWGTVYQNIPLLGTNALSFIDHSLPSEQ